MNLHLFTLGGIPVHLSLWAVLLIAWFAFRSGDPIAGVFAGLGLLISVLIHEFGHALLAARYRLSPAILLHAFGGVTQHQRATSDRHDAIIIAAGPGLQLLASAIFFAGWVGLGVAAPDFANHPYVYAFMQMFLIVGVFWAGVNLLPLWPLDGGKLYRLGLIHILNVKPAAADKITHWTGIVGHALLILAFFFLGLGFVFLIAILFGLFIFQNVQALRQGGAAGPVRRKNTHAKQLLEQARAAFAAEDWGEAARLGHQIRAEPDIPDKMIDEIFEIIALAHIFDGKLAEGVRFARRAPDRPRVVAAQVKALIALDRPHEAREILEERGHVLPDDVRRELETEAA